MNYKYEILDKESQELNWANTKCDKEDLMISVACGALAGIIDIFFVGGANTKFNEMSKLAKMSDNLADEIVKKVSRALGWNPKPGKENNMSSAIAFLESKFKVPYDHTTTKDVNGRFYMSAKNHHIKSLSHSPDPIGLIFSILDQFTNSGSFITEKGIIRIKAEDRGFRLEGDGFISKIYCGFCNWIGHILSDVAGSNGSRAYGNTGRGTGVPIPFMELFLFCNFGSFKINNDRQTLAELMVRVFQEGYDLRYAGAMAIPVIIEELLIRLIWAIRQYNKKSNLRECIPNSKHADLRLMLIVGNGTLCLFDGVDATIRSSGNALTFVLHMNIVAWTRLVLLVFKELRIRYGPIVDSVANRYLADIGLNDRYQLELYYNRIKKVDEELEEVLNEFIKSVEKDYNNFINGMNRSLNSNYGTVSERRIESVKFAKSQGVKEEKIFKASDETLEWIKQGWKK